MNILVTGIAGDIGAGIGRILRDFEPINMLIGCDVHGEHAGNHIFDSCEIVPKSSQPEYIESLCELVERRRIDAVIVTSEPELRFISALSHYDEFFKLPLIMANRKSMEIGFDKLKTSEIISSMSIPSPWTRLVVDYEPLSFPCILKSRYGAGNQGVYIVKNADEASSYRKLFPDFIWQEYLPDDDEEYTCGVYGCNDGTFRTIIFRRRLASGVTSFAQLVENPVIETTCKKVADKLNLKGSINIQLRLCSCEPMIFEINPRFSSTVAFRQKMGFRDVEWSLQEQILGEETTYNLSYPFGTKICRTFGERICD